MADSRGPRGLISDIRETGDLLKRYARQETVEPFKGLGRYLAWGVVGSLLMAIGVVLLVLAGMRALQTETNLDGNWSFVPYLIAVAALGLVVALVVYAVTKGSTPRSRT